MRRVTCLSRLGAADTEASSMEIHREMRAILRDSCVGWMSLGACTRKRVCYFNPKWC